MSDLLVSGVYSVDQMKSIQPDITIQLDDQGEVSKDSVLAALATAFGFPDYFGHNWDAAFDCLCDAMDAHDQLDVLFSSLPSATLDQASLVKLLKILKDVIDQQPKEKTLRFFLAGIPLLPHGNSRLGV